MRFIGADLHKKSITFCVLEFTAAGEISVVQRHRIPCCDVDRIRAFIASHCPARLVVEATIGYDWFALLAEKLVDRVVVANTSKLRVIAESTRKTDKIDAYVLAEFLARGMVPEIWRPTPRVRQHRALVRHRHGVQRSITSTKNRMRAILARYNADRANLFSKLGWQAAQKVDLLEEDRWLLEDLKQELETRQERLKNIDARLKAFAAKAPTREAEAREVLATLPGAGPVTIETILAELGDVRRFSNGDQVVAYAGLAPGVRSSDGKRRDLGLTKTGSPHLRWILIQLAHRLKVQTMRWRRTFERLKKRTGNNKATCAVARRILLVIYAMLRDGTAYQMPSTAVRAA